MRNTFVNTICDIAKNNEHIVLITGDLGFGVLDKFWSLYPDRFINAGICEQNMMSVATGLALEGKMVFVYSIANFPTMRCLEQIRNDVAYHNANVKIVSIGAGFAYGAAGITHHATEDIAIMRAIPNITIFSPADITETNSVIKCAASLETPCYIRLGRGGEKSIHTNDFDFKIGKAIKLISGKKVCIFSTGAILEEAYKLAISLNNKDISTSLYSFPTIKPIDTNLIRECAQKFEMIVTIEEHNIVGGFGSAISEVISEIRGKISVLKRFGLNDVFSSTVGNQDYLREYYSLTSNSIEKAILSIM